MMASKSLSEIKEHYIVDEKGKRIGVLLDPQAYQRILAALEELEAIRAYDAAKKNRAKKRFRLNRQLP
jgi:hypothetical protein